MRQRPGARSAAPRQEAGSLERHATYRSKVIALTREQAQALIQTVLAYESTSACWYLYEPETAEFDLRGLLTVPVAEAIDLHEDALEQGADPVDFPEVIAVSPVIEKQNLKFALDAAYDWIDQIVESARVSIHTARTESAVGRAEHQRDHG